MKTELMMILVCPQCQQDLKCLNESYEGNEIKAGTLLCKNEHSYAIKNFVPHFSPVANYVKTFEFIKRNSICNLPEREDRELSLMQMTEKEFREQTGFSFDELKGKRVLDAGCGDGRFISYLQKHQIDPIGVDMLPGIPREHVDPLKGKDNSGSHFIQASLFELPFRESSFDYIFSLGVLHHTPNPEDAFKNLVRYLKKSGKIAIWVYPRKPKTVVSDVLRHITTRMPLYLLLIIGFIITVPYGPLLRIPRIGSRLRSMFYRTRLPWHKQWNWRIHSFMDWYGSKYQFKFTNKEIQKWFYEASLKDIKSFAYETSAQGTKI